MAIKWNAPLNVPTSTMVVLVANIEGRIPLYAVWSIFSKLGINFFHGEGWKSTPLRCGCVLSFQKVGRSRRFNSCKMPRDIVNVQVSLIPKLKATFLKGEIWAPPSLLLGVHFTMAPRHKIGTKQCAKEGARSARGPLYDRILAQNNRKQCTRETIH